MAAKKDKTIAGQARKALVLRQITPSEYGRIAYPATKGRDQLAIMMGALYRIAPFRLVRVLETGSQ